MHCASNVNKVFSAQKKQDKIIRKRKSIYRHRYIERDCIMWRLSSEMHNIYSKNLIYVMYGNRKRNVLVHSSSHWIFYGGASCMVSIWFLRAMITAFSGKLFWLLFKWKTNNFFLNAQRYIPVDSNAKDLISIVFICVCWFVFLFRNQLKSKKNENKNMKKKYINSHGAC